MPKLIRGIGKRQIWGQIMELHAGHGLNQTEIAKLTDTALATVSYILTQYYYHVPDNPVTIVLQSKLNEPEKPGE